MDRITTEKRDGSDELAGSCEAISSGPPGSNRLIPFPRSSAATIAGDQEDAGVSSASASSFVSLGSAISPVILRLQGGFPKIRAKGAALGSLETAPFNQPALGEGEERGPKLD